MKKLKYTAFLLLIVFLFMGFQSEGDNHKTLLTEQEVNTKNDFFRISTEKLGREPNPVQRFETGNNVHQGSDRDDEPLDIDAKSRELGIDSHSLREMLNTVNADVQSGRLSDGDDPPGTDAISIEMFFNGLNPNDRFGTSIANAGDVNGNGYDDIIIGADGYNSSTGRAYIFFGGSSMNNTPDVILTGGNTSNYFGISVSGAGDVNGDGYSDVIVGADGYNSDRGRAYIFFGGPSMNNIPDVIMTGENAGNFFGISVSGAGDVNGDGYSDVIVGASRYNSNTGRAYIFYGSPSMNNTPDVIMTGENTNNYFGASVSGAGDINGDGFSDVIVGARGFTFNIGRAYIFYGGSSMNNTPNVILTGESSNNYFGASVSGAGDVNGDGYSDVIVGAYGYNSFTGRAYIFYGGPSISNSRDLIMTGESSNNFFGYSVSGAGDVNGDGYSDVIVGAYGYNSNTGRAYIFFGGENINNTPNKILTGFESGSRFGFSVAVAIDLNRDGLSNILIGTPFENINGNNSGRVYLYKNSLTGPDTPDEIYTGEGTTNFFGISVSGAGDVNGDGYSDVIVGAYGYNSVTGRAYIFYGGPTMNNTPNVILTGQSESNAFGISVSGAGDVNGDGYSDVIVGAPGYNSSTGRAYIFYGGPTMNNLPNVTLTGQSSSNYFGASVSEAGDVNGDGYSDVIVGAYGYNNATGRAYIFYGGSSMNNTPNVIMTGESTNNYFGGSVSGAGDVNGDGYSDVIVGADGYISDRGSAYIFFGGPSMNNIPDVIMIGENEGNFFGRSVSGAGDVNGDGYSDVIVGADGSFFSSGKAYIFYGGFSMNNTPDVILTSQSFGSSRFGFSVSGAGDVNGDGYSDVIVGAYGYNSVTGRAYVFYGGPTMNNTPDVIMTGENSGNFFGISVANVGDINNDGFSDVIVGAWGNNSFTGRAYLYMSTSPPSKPRIMSVKDVPNDQGGYVHLRWVRSGMDMVNVNMISGYQVQRSRPPGISGFAWETVANIPATFDPQYTYTAATWSDSNQYGNLVTYFRVTARTNDPNVFWRSNIMYGYSIDNLAPVPPINLIASQTQTSIDLEWQENTEPDLHYYNIYRNDTLIANSTTNLYTDIIVAPRSVFIENNPRSFDNQSSLDNDQIYEYKVTAVDVNGNESDPSNPVTVNFAPFTAVNLTIIPEGFYNITTGRLNMRDTVVAYLREVVSPYAIVDTAIGVLDSVTFTAEFEFRNADDGQYYIVIKHRNSLETWSKENGESYERGVAFNYDFTTSNSQSYGSSMILKNGLWCIYSGDVNQDGIINAVDRAMAWNERNSTGYQAEDVNGDGIVNAVDRGIIWNNRNKSVITPGVIVRKHNMNTEYDRRDDAGLRD